jgi:hypothetical protein
VSSIHLDPCTPLNRLTFCVKLIYTRGTPIPLFLLISSTDSQALDLLSATSSPAAKLICNSHDLSANTRHSATVADSRDIQSAVWISVPSNATTHAVPSRHLIGEIHIPTSLKPGARLKNWMLSVCLISICLYVGADWFLVCSQSVYPRCGRLRSQRPWETKLTANGGDPSCKHACTRDAAASCSEYSLIQPA